MNSLLSDISRCHSRICRSQASFSSSCACTFFPSEASLYFQWAAIPNSAALCISTVRIWISKGWPEDPITVVCRDWYMFAFGMAI